MVEELLERLFSFDSGSNDFNEALPTNAPTQATSNREEPIPDPAEPPPGDMGATAGASADLMLQRYLDGVMKKTEPKQCYKLNSSIISTEMKLFEATGKRPETLTKLYDCLSSIKPTSVESERAFSFAGNFISKI